MRVLVTGASSGIGKALLPLFAADGHDLVLVARRGDLLAQHKGDLERQFRVKVDTHVVDLAQPGAAEALFAATGPVDVVVNNAGFGSYGLFLDQTLARQREMIALNVVALAELTRLYAEPMQARGSGKILQVASTAAFQPGPRMAVYYATKAFVLSLSEALAVELAASGVTVTTLCPGPTRSEFMDVASYALTPLIERSMMTSEDVARIGYRALLRGDRLAVCGARNKVMAVASQVAPRGLVLAVTERIMRSRG